MRLWGLRNPSWSGLGAAVTRTLRPSGRGGTRACSGRKPKGVCGLLYEAFSLPDHKGVVMRNLILAAVVAASLSGCATRVLESYVGRSVPEAAVRYGPPTNVFDMPDGRRAFQWEMSSTYVTPRQSFTNVNVYAPPGSAYASGTANTTSYGGNVINQRCLYTVYGRYDPALSTWMIVAFEKPSFACE